MLSISVTARISNLSVKSLMAGFGDSIHSDVMFQERLWKRDRLTYLGQS